MTVFESAPWLVEMEPSTDGDYVYEVALHEDEDNDLWLVVSEQSDWAPNEIKVPLDRGHFMRFLNEAQALTSSKSPVRRADRKQKFESQQEAEVREALAGAKDVSTDTIDSSWVIPFRRVEPTELLNVNIGKPSRYDWTTVARRLPRNEPEQADCFHCGKAPEDQAACNLCGCPYNKG